MAAALATLVFAGKTGRRYLVSTYLSDASNVLAKFDESKVAAAGSNDSWTVKENGYLVDVCLTSDVATPTHLQVQANGAPTGDILDCTSHLASVVNRPALCIPLAAGTKFQLMQIA